MFSLPARSLRAWAEALPLLEDAEPEVVSTLVADVESNPENFSDFLLSVASLVDFTKTTSLAMLFSVSFLPSGDAVNSECVVRALEAFSRLCETPDLLDPSYTLMRLVYDLVGFMLYERYSDEWAGVVAKTVSSAATEAVFEKAVYLLAEMVESETVEKCMAYLAVMLRWIQYPEVQKAVSESARFGEMLHKLFSQSWFVTDSREQASVFFRDGTTDLTLAMVDSLDRAFEPYVARLTQVLRAFLSRGSRDQTLKVMSEFFKRMEKMSQDRFMFTAPGTEREEAFALNFEAVLVKLAICNAGNVSMIDPHCPYMKETLTPFRPEQMTLAPISEDQEKEWAAEVERANEGSPSYVSMFFFAAAYAIETGSGTLDRLLPNIMRHSESVRRNPDPMMSMVVNQVRAALKYSELAIEAGLLRHGKVNDFLVFADMVLDFMLHQAGIVGENVPEVPNNGFIHSPQYVFNSVMTFLKVCLAAGRVPNPLKYMSKIVMLFHNEKYLHYDNCKASVITLFSVVASSNQYKHLVVGVKNILQLMFPAVLKFYCSVQVTGQNASLYEKIQYRIECTNLLKVWLIFQEFRNYFREHMGDETITKFVFYLVDDTMYFTDQSISLLKTIHESTEEQQAHNDNPELQAEIQGEMYISRSNLGFWIQHTNKAIDLMVSIAGCCQESFHDNIILDTITKMILSLMDLYANHRNYFDIPDRQSLGLDPTALFTSLVTIICAVAGDQKIVGHMVENAMFPAVELAEALVPLVSEMVSMKLHEFQRFVAIAKEAKAAQEEDVIDTSDAPDEFLDGLMFELMDEPMKLPSGFYMDRKNLEKALLSKQLDPFTQVPLKLEDCVLDEDLKKRIDEYKAQKRSEQKK